MSQAASKEKLQNRNAVGHSDSSEEALTSRDELQRIYAPIAEPLTEVDRILQDELKTDAPWVDQLLQGNWIGGGKRIRPVFLLLSGAACGQIKESHIQMAVGVEMIHCATLVHDDVLDHAETRRHLPTVNSKWDNRASVLLGDFLFTHAFCVASQSNSPEALRLLARSANRVCEGEIRQNAWQGKFDLSETDYLAMIADKTAELCSCSCHLGALLSGADVELCRQFESYGQNLGVAFQIIDDVLDLIGAPEKVGKTLGTDLANQKPTLPVIHALKNADSATRSWLLNALQNESVRFEEIVSALNEAGSIDYARVIARNHANSALEFAQELGASQYAKSLAKLAHFVCQRTC